MKHFDEKTAMFLTAFGLVLTLIAVSCESKNKPDNYIVANAMTALRQELPLRMEGLGKVSDIDYEGNKVLFHMRIKEDDSIGMNVNKISNNKALAKEIVFIQIGMMNDQIKDALKDIAEQSFGLRVVVDGSNYNHGLIELSSEEIKVALSNKEKRTDEDFSLEMVALTTRMMLPAQVDQITTWTDTRMTDTSFEYVYRIDDDDIDMNGIDISMLKNEKLTMLRQNMDVMRNVVCLCKSTRRNLIYRYIGNRSAKTIDVVLTYSDLETI